MRQINPSANNSANYIKKIPVIIPDIDTLEHINELVKTLLDKLKNNKSIELIENELDDIFNIIYFESTETNINREVQQELFA